MIKLAWYLVQNQFVSLSGTHSDEGRGKCNSPVSNAWTKVARFNSVPGATRYQAGLKQSRDCMNKSTTLPRGICGIYTFFGWRTRIVRRVWRVTAVEGRRALMRPLEEREPAAAAWSPGCACTAGTGRAAPPEEIARRRSGHLRMRTKIVGNEIASATVIFCGCNVTAGAGWW